MRKKSSGDGGGGLRYEKSSLFIVSWRIPEEEPKKGKKKKDTN